MKVEPLGDAAWLLRDLPISADAWAVQFAATKPPGVIEAVASYDTVAVYVDPERFDPSSLAFSGREHGNASARRHVIPVCYTMGPDLAEVAALLNLSGDDVIYLHTSEDFRCYAVGFCPGFPYLGYLPEPLSGVARLDQPRLRVDPGMVGITGRQTGIYPLARPGGWRLIGRTPLVLVDPDDDYFPIAAGDTVRFQAITADQYAEIAGDRLPT